MILKELKTKLKAIEKHIRQTKLIDKCYEVTKKYGHGATTVHDCWTNVKYQYNGQDIKIDYNDGLSMMGGGHIEIYSEGERVLDLNRNGDKGLYPIVDGFVVQKYIPGDWETRLKELVTQKPKIEKPTKKVNPLEEKVSEETLSDIKSRFKI